MPNLLPPGRLEAANQLTLATTYGFAPIAAVVVLALLTPGSSAACATRPEQRRQRDPHRAVLQRADVPRHRAGGVLRHQGDQRPRGRAAGEEAQPAPRVRDRLVLRRQDPAGPRPGARHPRRVRRRRRGGRHRPVLRRARSAVATSPSTSCSAASSSACRSASWPVRGWSARCPGAAGSACRSSGAAISVTVLAFAWHLVIGVVGALLRRRRRRHGVPVRHHAARHRGDRRRPRPGVRVHPDRHAGHAAADDLAVQLPGRPRRLPADARLHRLDHPAAAAGRRRRSASSPGIGALRQMDDKPGVPLFADLVASLRGQPLATDGPLPSLADGGRPLRRRRPVHRLRGRRGRRQVDPGAAGWPTTLRGIRPLGRRHPRAGRDTESAPASAASCSITATMTTDRRSRPEPRPCCTRPTAPTTSRP